MDLAWLLGDQGGDKGLRAFRVVLVGGGVVVLVIMCWLGGLCRSQCFMGGEEGKREEVNEARLLFGT